MNTKSYSNINPANVAAKIEEAGGPKMDLTQPTGVAEVDGVKLSWSLTKRVITNGPVDAVVTIVSKPWIVPASAVWSHVDALFM